MHPDDVVCYKVGAFGKDAYIISYLFEYSLIDAKENVASCGFSKRAISKVCAKINYVMIDTRNNYEVDEKFEHICRNIRKSKKIYKTEEKVKMLKMNY